MSYPLDAMACFDRPEYPKATITKFGGTCDADPTRVMGAKNSCAIWDLRNSLDPITGVAVIRDCAQESPSGAHACALRGALLRTTNSVDSANTDCDSSQGWNRYST